jgi:sugar/nucleoside kinase (ribokinase family)
VGVPTSGRVIVVGDLNVDEVVDAAGGPVLRPGGTAFNAATAFRAAGFRPAVVGAVGRDADGRLVERGLARESIEASLVRCERPTGACRLRRTPGAAGRVSNGDRSANAVDPAALLAPLDRLGPGPADVVFVATHLLARHTAATCRRFFAALAAVGARLVVDLVPHNLAARVGGEAVESCLRGLPFLLVAELHTVRSLLGSAGAADAPRAADWDRVHDRLAPWAVALRHGRFGVEYESLSAPAGAGRTVRVRATGFDREVDMCGFGDRLTARLLRSLV